MNEIENNQHDQKIKELVGKVRQELGSEIIEKPNSKVNEYLSEIENLETVIPEETKKLWTELGIAEDTNQQKLVQEVQRLAELFATENSQKIKVHFATEKTPQEQLKGQNGTTEKKDEEFHIYLNLERKDKQGNFCPNLENLTEEYQKQFTSLLTPSTFPQELLEIKDLYQVYFPNLEDIPDSQTSQALVNPEIVDKTWSMIRQELIELTSQEVKKNPSEEELNKLAIKATINGSADQHYTILVNYHSQSPCQEKIKELIATTPLQLENEALKQKTSQLPSPENFAKLTKQKTELENYLQDYMTGSLDLNYFTKLEELKCCNNPLTALMLFDCPNLKKLEVDKEVQIFARHNIKELVRSELAKKDESQRQKRQARIVPAYALIWNNIHADFTLELTKVWQDLGFTQEQVHD
ncbi:3037_t:CDS:2 [Entrophospora sp. SA101]|nr:3037_t:CDS:2 [Entrophospora sp. SA101]